MLPSTPNTRLRCGLALAAALVAGWAVTGDATAQSGGGAMPMQHEHMSCPAADSSHSHRGPFSTNPVISAYQAANEKMHRDMMIPFTGDADRDFVAGMIPHHQGAIDMAEVVLKYGKDPEVRMLAQEIIAAQQKEVAWMKAWLAKKPQ